jgi:hypothetical protein
LPEQAFGFVGAFLVQQILEDDAGVEQVQRLPPPVEQFVLELNRGVLAAEFAQRAAPAEPHWPRCRSGSPVGQRLDVVGHFPLKVGRESPGKS